jgi:hypothetical protein
MVQNKIQEYQLWGFTCLLLEKEDVNIAAATHI